MTEPQRWAAHAAAWIGGGIGGALLWGRHPVLGFIVGSILGSAAATFLVGEHPIFAEIRARDAAAREGRLLRTMDGRPIQLTPELMRERAETPQTGRRPVGATRMNRGMS